MNEQLDVNSGNNYDEGSFGFTASNAAFYNIGERVLSNKCYSIEQEVAINYLQKDVCCYRQG